MPDQQLYLTIPTEEFFLSYPRRRVRDTAQVLPSATIQQPANLEHRHSHSEADITLDVMAASPTPVVQPASASAGEPLSPSAAVSTDEEIPEGMEVFVPMLTRRDEPVVPATTQPQPGLTHPIDSVIPLPQVTQPPPSGQSPSTDNDPIPSTTSPDDDRILIYFEPPIYGYSHITLKLRYLLPQTVPPEMKVLLKRSYDPNPKDAILHYGMAFHRKDKPRIWVPFPTYCGDCARRSGGFVPSVRAYTQLAMMITYNIYSITRVAEYFGIANRSGFNAGIGHEPSPEVFSDWIRLVHAAVRKCAPAILLEAGWSFLCQSKRVLEFNVKFHLIVESYFIANGFGALREASVAVPMSMAPSASTSPDQITPLTGEGTPLFMETPKRPGPRARQRNDDESMEWTCLVCLEEPRNCIPFICQHLTMCGDCASKLKSQDKNGMSCPICREKGRWPIEYWTIYNS